MPYVDEISGVCIFLNELLPYIIMGSFASAEAGRRVGQFPVESCWPLMHMSLHGCIVYKFCQLLRLRRVWWVVKNDCKSTWDEAVATCFKLLSRRCLKLQMWFVFRSGFESRTCHVRSKSDSNFTATYLHCVAVVLFKCFSTTSNRKNSINVLPVKSRQKYLSRRNGLCGKE